jgi:acyl-CoA dehydrogenase
MITTVVSIIIGITLVSLVVLFGVRPLRRALISRPIFNTYKRILPQMSDTERVALEAGTVWWDGELFRGNPDWNKLLAYPVPNSGRRAVLHGQRGRAGLCAGG